jgi:DNA replication protein DnaC
MGTVQSKNLMQELKLTGMLEQFESALSSATAQGFGHAEFLDILLQSEYDFRKKRKIESRISLSKLPHKWVFEDFDYSANRSITKTQIKDLITLKWLEQGRPILLIGQTGVGKSFIAEAVAMQACRNGKVSLWMDISAFLEALLLSRTSGTYIKLREKLTRPDILVIDDFGMRKLNSTEAQDLSEILEARSVGRSTIITTQLPLDHWIEVIEDPVIADAVTDRLKYSAIQINLVGESYRKVKAKKLDDINSLQ